MSLHPDIRKQQIAFAIREQAAAEELVRAPADVLVVVTSKRHPEKAGVLNILMKVHCGISYEARFELDHQAVLDRINWPEHFGPDDSLEIMEGWA